MKEKTIRLIGKVITENLDELEEGYVEIGVNVEDTLNEFDSEDIVDYACSNLGLKHENDFESDFDEDELIQKLKDDGYDFTQQLDEEQCSDFLEDKGYKIDVKTDVDELDIVDQEKLSEIINRFCDGSWIEKDRIYKSVCS